MSSFKVVYLFVFVSMLIMVVFLWRGHRQDPLNRKVALATLSLDSQITQTTRLSAINARTAVIVVNVLHEILLHHAVNIRSRMAIAACWDVTSRWKHVVASWVAILTVICGVVAGVVAVGEQEHVLKVENLVDVEGIQLRVVGGKGGRCGCRSGRTKVWRDLEAICVWVYEFGGWVGLGVVYVVADE